MLVDIKEFDDTCYTEAPEGEVHGKVDYNNKEIIFSCRYEPTMLISRMWKILYGWKAKGPVRKRVLGKLWGLRR